MNKIPFIVIILDGEIQTIRQTTDQDKDSDLLAALSRNYPGVEWSQAEIDNIVAAGKFKFYNHTISITWVSVTV